MNQIKTWQQRQAETGIGSIQAKEDEIDDLRAALAERDAELERRHGIGGELIAARRERDAQRRVLEQALEALNVMQEDVVSTPNAYEAQRQAVRAILEVLHE